MTSPRHPSRFQRLAAPLVDAVKKVRTAALATGLIAAVVALAVLGWRIYEIRRDNAIIAALAAGDDVPVDGRRASDEVLVARSHYLLKYDRWEEAQSLLDATASSMSDPRLRARLLYNHANARVREALDAVGRSDIDKAIPLTRLAKDEYRLALRLDPFAWDIKHNYDVAMRIVRDFPGAEQEDEDVPPDAPKRLWTDLPGVPKGLP
jgi:mxaK protein